jgi:hypothetical protein
MTAWFPLRRIPRTRISRLTDGFSINGMKSRQAPQPLTSLHRENIPHDKELSTPNPSTHGTTSERPGAQKVAIATGLQTVNSFSVLIRQFLPGLMISVPPVGGRRMLPSVYIRQSWRHPA